MTTIVRTEPRESERLRRQAGASDQGPSDEHRDMGAQAFGRIMNGALDPQDPTNVSFPFLRRMRRDHVVAMALHLIGMPLVRAPFYFDADDARAAAYADNLVRPIYGSSMLTILRMLWSGYSPAAKNYEVVQPSWKYMVDGEIKQVWESSAIGALVYKPLVPLRPESCRLSYDQQGRWSGILWDEAYVGRGGFHLNGIVKPQVDLGHAIWATHDRENEDSSPYGFPRIAHCAPIFHMYRWLWTLLGRAFENNADPGPVVGFPEDEGPVPDGELSNKETALMIATRKRSGSGIAAPSTPYSNYANDRTTSQRKWFIEYIKTETDFSSMQDFIGYLEAAKFRALWIAEQSSIEGDGGSSSRNVVENLSSQRDASQSVLMQQIMDDVIMAQLVRPNFAINMPWYEGKLEMKTLGFGQQDEDLIRQVLQLVGQQDHSKFGIDYRRLAESKGFPMLDIAELSRELKRKEEQAASIGNQTGAPAIEPTQGRRALVTQTGFTDRYGNPEMAYVQLHDPVDMRSRQDGDFVASLPRDDVWGDRSAIDSARLLRSAAQDFLERSSRDLEILVSKSSRVEDLDETRRSETVERWLPRRERSDELLSTARRALKLARPSADEAWLDDQAARVLTELSEDVRYGAGADYGSTPSKVAARVALETVRSARVGASVDEVRSSGVRWVQRLDDGAIVPVGELDGTRRARALPGAPDGLEVRHEVLDGDHLARYDEAAGVVLLSSELTPDQETEYLLALGDRLSRIGS